MNLGRGLACSCCRQHAGDSASFEIIGWFDGGRSPAEGLRYRLELGYRRLALAARPEMAPEGLGVAWIQGTKGPARRLDVLKHVVHVIWH